MPSIYNNNLSPTLWGAQGNTKPITGGSSSSGGTANAGGTAGELQYNANGVFGGVYGTNYDANTGILDLGPVSNVKISGGQPGQVLSINNAGNMVWLANNTESQPQIHFVVPVTAINQSFADPKLLTFQSGEWAGVFRNGVLLPSDQYTIVDGVLNIDTQMFANDRIDVLPTTSGSTATGNIGNVNLNGDAGTFLDGTGAWSSVIVPQYGTVANLNLNGNITQYLRGDGTWANVPTSGGNISNINLNGNTVQYLRGDGQWANVAVPVGNIGNTNYNGNAATYLNGQGAWVQVSGGSGIPGGANSQLQFNNNGVFGGIGNTSFNGTQLTLGNVANVKILGGNANGILKTDGTGNLSWANLVNYSAVPRMEFQVTSAGNNQSFTNPSLAAYPTSSYATVFRNGVLMDPTDYTISGTIITFPIYLEIGESIDVTASATTGSTGGGGSGGGTVTQVDVGGTGLGFTLTGGPITTAGTVTLTTPNVDALRTTLAIGNVANANFTGNGSVYLRGNGTWGGLSTVAGNTTEIQYNNGGVLSATNNMRYDTATTTVTFEGPTNLLDNVVVEGNITPFSTNTYSLGNTTHRWKDVFLSSNSVVLGDITLSSNVGLRVDGVPVVTAPNNTITVGNVAANLFIGSGANLTNINGSNVSKVAGAGSADVAYSVSAANIVGTVANANVANVANTANSVALANVVGIGNIASLNLNGNVSQFLTGNGTYAVPVTPAAGATGQLQFNNANAFGSSANLSWDDANSKMSVTGTLTVSGTINVTGFKETVAAFANTGASIAPDAALGTVYQYTANSNFTFNGFTNPVAGQSVMVIVKQDATGSRLMTSTMKFSGNNRALSTSANSTDMMCIFYTGTDYLASLTQGYL